MPSVATQTAYGDVIESVSLGSPRSPNTSSKDWRQTQRPSWLLIANRRSGMSMKKHWTMKHVITETEGGLFIQLRGIGYVQKHYDDFNFHKSSDVVGMIICAA